MIVVTVAPIFSRSLECSPRFLEFPIERVLKIPCNFLIFPKFLVIPWDSLKLLGILWDSQRILKIPNQLLLHIYTDLLALKHLYLNFKFIHEFWSNSVFTFPNSTLQFDMSTMTVGTNTMRQSLTPRTGSYLMLQRMVVRQSKSFIPKTDLCLQLWETQGKVLRLSK